MNKSFAKILKALAVLLAVALMVASFAACSEEEVEPTPIPTQEPVHSPAPLAPVYNIEYDPEQFIVSGSTLKEYIGEGGDVEVPKDITVIGTGAFAGADKVTSVTFPSSVLTIEAYAFEGCTGLTGKFTPPRNLNYIEDYAFKDCTGITEISFENKLYSFGEHIFEGCTALEKVTLPEKFLDSSAETVLPAYTFSGCTALKEVTIFKEATGIGEGAFKDCSALTSVTLPDKVKVMGRDVFAGCTSLSEITFSKVLYSVGGGTFNDTPWFAAQLQETANKVAQAATDEEKKLAGYLTVGQNAAIAFVPAEATGDIDLLVPEAVYSLNEGTFDGLVDRITSITYQTGTRLEFLGDNLFAGAAALKSISLPSKLKTINDGLFDGCASLEKVEIVGRLEAIGNNSFRDCAKLAEVYLPDTIKSIGDNAFLNCSSLKEIVFPSAIESIGDYAFKNCVNIENFVFTLKLSDVGVQAFDNTKWYDDLSVYEEPLTENRFHVYGNGVLIKADIVDENIVIPDNVKSIGAFTFNGWTEIKDREFYGSKLPRSITIPDGVTRIGDYAFYFCENLETVFIAETVTEIGEKAFYGCAKVTSVVIPSAVTEIKDYTFYGCDLLSELVLPANLTSIGRYAFYNCYSLEELDIPESVTSIGAFAFANTPWFSYHNEEYFTLGTILVKYSGTGNAVIPEGTTYIVGGAFEGETTTSVKLPASMTVIPEYAFCGAVNLKDIDLSGITAIETRAFNGCRELTLTVDTAAVNVADDAFVNCPNVTLK